MSHVAHTNDSWHTYKWVISHIQISHDRHISESWHTYRWFKAPVKTYLQAVHRTMSLTNVNMNDAGHTYKWAISHVQKSHGRHISESWHTCRWVTAHVKTYLRAVHRTMSLTDELWHTYRWVMAHVSMSHSTHHDIPASRASNNVPCKSKYKWFIAHI